MTQHRTQYSSVWVVTQQHEILKVDTSGKVEEKSPSNFAITISFSIDQTLWMVPYNNGPADGHILYSEDEGENWNRVDAENLKISKISATHLGSCFILTPQGSIHLIQKSGEIRLIFEEETANDIAISPEGYIWIISRLKKEGGGNLVYWCALDDYVLQPVYGQPVAKRISAGPGGTARIITTGGEIASIYINRMGGLETPGGEVFAKNIAAGYKSNTMWAVCSENSGRKKKNVLKFWNPDIDPYMKWHSVPEVEPYDIAGGD